MPWIREEFVEFVGVLVLSVRVHVVRLILVCSLHQCGLVANHMHGDAFSRL